MTDFAFLATAYARAATAIANSEDSDPGTRHGTDKVSAGASNGAVSYIARSDRGSAPARRCEHPRISPSIADKKNIRNDWM